MALGYLNVVALADDGTLIFGSTRDGVRGALAAAAGTEPSFAGRADVAPLLRAAPADLVSALLVDGELLRAVADPAAAFLGDESPQDFATRVAEEQVEARRLPPVAAALLGRTAGLLSEHHGHGDARGMPASPARLVVALSTTGPDAAETAATVIAERLATGRTPPLMSGEMADRPWAELFPQRVGACRVRGTGRADRADACAGRAAVHPAKHAVSAHAGIPGLGVVNRRVEHACHHHGCSFSIGAPPADLGMHSVTPFPW